VNLSPNHVAVPLRYFHTLLTLAAPHLSKARFPLPTKADICVVPSHLFEQLIAPPSTVAPSAPVVSKHVDGGATQPTVPGFIDMTAALQPASLGFSSDAYDPVDPEALESLADDEHIEVKSDA
jgi:hypothetical protein